MRIAALTAALLTAACGTAQSPQYFVLPDSQYIRPAERGAEIAVKAYLSDALDTGGLVYQTDAYRLNFARNHLWANPLDDALANNLSNRLNSLNRRYTFVPAARSQSTQQLKIYVEAFNGSYSGQTVVSGYAQWPNGASRPFRVETVQQGDGYAAMVESLAEGLKQAATEMLE
ncbi:Lipoprotein [Bergeriella denitrificans]|uniref:Lipoprotein n=2 Tax=Bergeriella denitrificans TaxID=494 RepID=A0A378UHB5_BERDE|nr:ABC-type transport auxiliary lipoprotein family protein [Bergeriella denitrificans]STZ76768.1 Lipoprotein [Bergeriella denitrificans]